MTELPPEGVTDTELLVHAFSSRERAARIVRRLDWGVITPDGARAAIAADLFEERGEADRMKAFLARMQASRATEPPPPAPDTTRIPPPTTAAPVVPLAAIEIPERFHTATFDTYDVHYSGPAYVEQLTVAKKAVRVWVDGTVRGKAMCLALVGSTGNGKSHLLWAAVRELHATGVRVYGRSWYRLADELRIGGRLPWAATLHSEPHDIRYHLHAAKVVALDEVCSTSGTMFDESELGKCIKNGWDRRHSLIVTTNVNPLANLMGEAAADRFTVIMLTAPTGRHR